MFSFSTENNSPLGVAVFNSSGPAYHTWKEVELAVSTFWPNFYQVKQTPQGAALLTSHNVMLQLFVLGQRRNINPMKT